jgi:hypothetical protein
LGLDTPDTVCYRDGMETTRTTSTPIDCMCEAGMLPTDDLLELDPKWLNRWDGYRPARKDLGTWVVTSENYDELVVQLLDRNGWVIAEVRFNAPDGRVSDPVELAFRAVVFTWGAP